MKITFSLLKYQKQRQLNYSSYSFFFDSFTLSLKVMDHLFDQLMTINFGITIFIFLKDEVSNVRLKFQIISEIYSQILQYDIFYLEAIISLQKKRMTQKKITGYTIFMEKLLGKGSYGSVYKGVKDSTQQAVAVKVIQKKLIDSDQYMKSALYSEIQILQMIKSENVVALYDVMQSSHNYYLIQQICDGDLQKLMEKQGKFEEEKAISLLKEICNGFLALVRQGIVHRDVKPANIMLAKGHAKIGDFGFAKKKYKSLKIQSTVGTPLYMSPQILKSQPYTSKCDIWALGFIFYQLIHGTTPWTARSQYELVKNIQTKQYKLIPTLKQKTKDFINRCLEREQQKRISWDQLFVHQIFQGFFKEFSQKNVQFENKLKRIMSDLRFKIHEQNIDLKKLFSTLGFSPNHDLSFKQFSKLLKSINPSIKSQEEVYFFQKMDQNGDGNVSLVELQQEMQKNYINLTSKCQNELVDILLFGRSISLNQQSFDDIKKKSMDSQLQMKVKKCFVKLYRILTLKKLTLYRTFVAYDADRSGQLGIEEFEKILKRLDGSFTRQQIQSVFQFIDRDKSKTIQFDELNSYYCKVNGIPKSLDLPAEYNQGKTKQ